MTKRRLTSALAIAMFAGAVATQGSPVRAGEVATPAAPVGPAVRWLALGDSFSSGEGISGTNSGNPALQGQDNCVRANGDNTNAKAYAVTAVEALSQIDHRYRFEAPFFVACTGAITDSALTQLAEMRTVVPADLQSWNVISMSFGGNNIRFAEVLRGCLDLNSIWGFFDLSPGCDISEQQLRNRVDMLAGKRTIDARDYVGTVTLPVLYDTVAAAVATGGHVFILGYPQIVEEVGRWEEWRRKRLNNCERILSSDVGMLRSVTGYLNEQIALAVADANSRWAPSGIRFHFVDIATDVYETSTNSVDRHGLCSADSWLNGISTGVTSGDWRWERSFHPHQKGHDATGEYVAGLVRELTFDSSNSVDLCADSAISQDLGGDWFVLEGLCRDGWAYIDSCRNEPCGDSDAIARVAEGHWTIYTYFPTFTICRSQVISDGAPLEIVDRIIWADELGAVDCSSGSAVLREGDSGEAIRELQQELVARGYLLEVDGFFGPTTTAAVRDFQTELFLEVDGLGGPVTQATLGVGPNRATVDSSPDQLIIDIMAYMNGGGADVPSAVQTAFGGYRVPELSATWGAAINESATDGRQIVEFYFSGDGGVYLYGEFCVTSSQPSSWCGLWYLQGH